MEPEADLTPLSEFVLDELKQHRQQDDIIVELCSRTGWQRREAKRFVAQVRREHRKELQPGETWTIFATSLVAILGGVVSFGITAIWFTYKPGVETFYLPNTREDLVTFLAALLSHGPIAYLFIGLVVSGALLILGGVSGLILAVLQSVVGLVRCGIDFINKLKSWRKAKSQAVDEPVVENQSVDEPAVTSQEADESVVASQESDKSEVTSQESDEPMVESQGTDEPGVEEKSQEADEPAVISQEADEPVSE
jgi:hypothetical protein